MNNDDQDIQLQELLMMLATQEENELQKKFSEKNKENQETSIATMTNELSQAQEPSYQISTENIKSPEVKKKTRCQLCNKKLPLALRFECRCGFNYCSLHKASDTHQCSFDYKTYDRKILEKHNQKVVADKLERI